MPGTRFRKVASGVDPDALKAYGSTIEEARADLFGLYYVADPKLLELGLVPSEDAYKAEYYTYLMNGLMTQLVRIEPGNNVEEAHMRNRQLIARWVFEKGKADKVGGNGTERWKDLCRSKRLSEASSSVRRTAGRDTTYQVYRRL